MEQFYNAGDAGAKEPVSGAERRRQRRNNQALVSVADPEQQSGGTVRRISPARLILESVIIAAVIFPIIYYFVNRPEYSGLGYDMMESGYGVVEHLYFYDGWFSDTYRIYDRQVYYKHVQLTSDGWAYIDYPNLSDLHRVRVQVLWDESKTRLEVGSPRTLTYDNLNTGNFKIFPTQSTHSGIKFDALPYSGPRAAEKNEDFSHTICLRKVGGNDNNVVVLFMMPLNRSEYLDNQAEQRGNQALRNNALPNDQNRFTQFAGRRSWL